MPTIIQNEIDNIDRTIERLKQGREFILKHREFIENAGNFFFYASSGELNFTDRTREQTTSDQLLDHAE